MRSSTRHPAICRRAAETLSRLAAARSLPGDARVLSRENVSALQKAQFYAEHLPEPAMTPHEAARHLVRNDVDYLPIDQIEGRIASTLFVVYPPGIATIVSGERLPRGRVP